MDAFDLLNAAGFELLKLHNFDAVELTSAPVLVCPIHWKTEKEPAMNDALDQMIEKHATEMDVRKRAHSLVNEADSLLDGMAKAHAAEHSGNYLDSYGAVCKTELGHRILTHREQMARFIESTPSVNVDD
jgi:hypothetical protein